MVASSNLRCHFLSSRPWYGLFRKFAEDALRKIPQDRFPVRCISFDDNVHLDLGNFHRSEQINDNFRGRFGSLHAFGRRPFQNIFRQRLGETRSDFPESFIVLCGSVSHRRLNNLS